MNNVAVNLVATMMQNNFSGKTYQLPNSQGLTHSNFSSILKQTQTSRAGSSTAALHRNDVNQINNGQSVRDQEPKYKENNVTNNEGTDELRNETSKRSTDNREVKVNKHNVSDNRSSENKKETEEVISTDNEVVNNVNSTSTDQNSVDGTTEATESDEVGIEVDELEMQLTEDIAQALGISPEALGQILQQMQMTVYDLFNPAKFKALMQEALNVTSSMDLLVSESSLEKLQKVVEVLTSVAEEVTKLEDGNKLKNALNTSTETEDGNESQNLTIRLMNSLSTTPTANTSTSSDGSLGGMATTGANTLTQSTLSENLDSTFQGILNQVVTQKTETIVMNGTITTIFTEVTAKDVLDQIVTGMKVQVNEGNSKVVLQLNPENLGKIALSISHEKGVITGQFVAESEAVKKIIESNLNQLKTQLQSQGINVDSLKIVVGDSTAFFAGEQEKGNGKENFESKRSRRIGNISNISSTFADTILEEDAKTDINFIHENSSIELHA